MNKANSDIAEFLKVGLADYFDAIVSIRLFQSSFMKICQQVLEGNIARLENIFRAKLNKDDIELSAWPSVVAGNTDVLTRMSCDEAYLDVYVPVRTGHDKIIYGISLGASWEVDEDNPGQTVCSAYVAAYPRSRPFSERLEQSLKQDKSIRRQVYRGYDMKTGHYVELNGALSPNDSGRLEKKLEDIVGHLAKREERIHQALSQIRRTQR